MLRGIINLQNYFYFRMRTFRAVSPCNFVSNFHLTPLHQHFFNNFFFLLFTYGVRMVISHWLVARVMCALASSRFSGLYVCTCQKAAHFRPSQRMDLEESLPILSLSTSSTDAHINLHCPAPAASISAPKIAISN